MRLRHEEPGDEQQIAAMVAAAFVGKPYSHQNEHFIIDGLRRDGAMTISLVAEDAGAIVGHVAFSPITVDDREVNWHGMGPVAVAPARQLQGIGSAMIRDGIAQLRALGSAGCVVLGNPAYYTRFGFRQHPRLLFPHAPARDFMVMPFGEQVPEGEAAYHPAFDATE